MNPTGRKDNTLKKLERMNAALRHEEPDRVPISDFFWGAFVERWRRELHLPADASPLTHYDLDWTVITPNLDPWIRPFPAIVGLLPVVGGAMLSAPLVAEASDDLRLPPERRTFLNYWFRHVWEYTLPTFPAVFLTAGITGVPITELATAGAPLTLAAIAAGVFFGLRGLRPPRPGGVVAVPCRRR